MSIISSPLAAPPTKGLVTTLFVTIKRLSSFSADTTCTENKANLNDYLTSKLTAGQRRILFMKWIGQAWEETAGKKEMVIRSFKKFGISTAIDGSEDDEINIAGLDDYCIGNDKVLEGNPFGDLDTDSD